LFIVADLNVTTGGMVNVSFALDAAGSEIVVINSTSVPPQLVLKKPLDREVYINILKIYIYELVNERTNERTNKRTNGKTNQPNKQTNEQTNKQINKQTDKQTNEKTNEPTKQTYKQTNK